MENHQGLLLSDDDPAHAAIFRDAPLNAEDGPLQGEWLRTLVVNGSRAEKFWWFLSISVYLTAVG